MAELVIRGERFACGAVHPWAAMKLAKSQKGDELSQVAGLYDFIMSIIVNAEERTRFEVYMDANADLSQEELDEALGNWMVEHSGRPLGLPSSSSSGSTTNGASSSPVSSSPAMESEEDTSWRDGL